MTRYQLTSRTEDQIFVNVLRLGLVAYRQMTARASQLNDLGLAMARIDAGVSKEIRTAVSARTKSEGIYGPVPVTFVPVTLAGRERCYWAVQQCWEAPGSSEIERYPP
jgi:hypothetical protein